MGEVEAVAATGSGAPTEAGEGRAVCAAADAIEYTGAADGRRVNMRCAHGYFAGMAGVAVRTSPDLAVRVAELDEKVANGFDGGGDADVLGSVGMAESARDVVVRAVASRDVSKVE